MANGPLQRIVSGARDLRSFRQEGVESRERADLAPLRRRTTEAKLGAGELDLQRAQTEFGQSKRLNDLFEVASIPAQQRGAFLQQKRSEMIQQGEDTRGIDALLQLPEADRDERIDQGLQFAQQQGLVKTPGGAQQAPSAVQEFQFFQGLTDQEKETFINIKRAQPGSTLVEIEGRKGAFDRGTGAFTALSTAEGERAAAAETVAATATAKGEAETELKRAETAPQRAEKARSIVSSIDGVFDTVNEAIGLTGIGTAGFAALLDFIPTSDARQLGNLVGTVQANIGFDKLQSMRDSSPTGGALGQVSERELNFLQSTIANLDRKAKPEQLKKQLNKILTHYKNWRGAVINARGRDLMRDGLTEEQALEQIRTEFPQ